MKVTPYKRRESEPLDDLRTLLQGRVFHVTRLAALPEILRSGVVLANRDRSLPTTFGYLENGYFRNLGCVSLFDYRAELTEQLEFYRAKCDPFQEAAPDRGGVAILFVGQGAYGDLVPWTKWKDDNAQSEMVVPYVEAGYRGAMPVELFDEILTLELTEDPDSIMAIHRRAFARRRASGR
jgi:hypothetical protein